MSEQIEFKVCDHGIVIKDADTAHAIIFALDTTAEALGRGILDGHLPLDIPMSMAQDARDTVRDLSKSLQSMHAYMHEADSTFIQMAEALLNKLREE